jgi:PKD repeat protein
MKRIHDSKGELLLKVCSFELTLIPINSFLNKEVIMKKNLFFAAFFIMISICSATTIYDIQYTTNTGPDGTYPSPMDGQDVTVTGIVTGANLGQDNKFFMSDPEGGAWHGIYVYDYEVGPALGDEVEVTATVTEYHGLTELGYCTITILSSGNPVPAPSIVSTLNLVVPAQAEPYEGCLVEVANVEVTEAQGEYGQWFIDDGSGECQVDDGFFYLDEVTPPIVITIGMEWAVIRGILDYSFDEYGINPRTPDDMIDEIIPVEADFSADSLIGTAPFEVQFTDSSIGVITSWEWDFENDGTIDSNEQSPVFTYSEIGVYTVSLTVTDGMTTDTETKVDYIEVEVVLEADFSADPVSGIAPLEVVFTSISTGNVTSWEWDFDNDGSIDSIEENPTYIYTNASDYSVSLTAGDGVTSDTETKIDYILVGDQVVADFTADPLFGMAPLAVNFTNTSSGPVTSWEWDFDNDGSIDSTEENPSFTYTEIGIYTVSLTVSDGTNTDTETKIDYIETTLAGSNDLPANITKLYSNFPNPFNPTTVISFSVQTGDQANLVVFNSKGQQIESQKFGAGMHNWKWNAENCPSGVYFYKLISSEYTETRKMLLLK